MELYSFAGDAGKTTCGVTLKFVPKRWAETWYTINCFSKGSRNMKRAEFHIYTVSAHTIEQMSQALKRYPRCPLHVIIIALYHELAVIDFPNADKGIAQREHSCSVAAPPYERVRCGDIHRKIPRIRKISPVSTCLVLLKGIKIPDCGQIYWGGGDYVYRNCSHPSYTFV